METISSSLTILETARLIVRPWRESDIDPMRVVFTDPRVTRYTEGQPWSEAELRGLVNWCLAHNAGRLGLFFNCPLTLRADGQVIGRVGINPLRDPGSPFEGQPEIEWTLATAYWGQGYASEIGQAMVTYAFQTAAFERLYGFAHPENGASRHVLEKIGMRYQGLVSLRGEETTLYVIENPSCNPPR